MLNWHEQQYASVNQLVCPFLGLQVTLSKFFNPCYTTAQLKPTLFSKVTQRVPSGTWLNAFLTDLQTCALLECLCLIICPLVCRWTQPSSCSWLQPPWPAPSSTSQTVFCCRAYGKHNPHIDLCSVANCFFRIFVYLHHHKCLFVLLCHSDLHFVTDSQQV